jgi:hypothetical protein
LVTSVKMSNGVSHEWHQRKLVRPNGEKYISLGATPWVPGVYKFKALKGRNNVRIPNTP